MKKISDICQLINSEFNEVLLAVGNLGDVEPRCLGSKVLGRFPLQKPNIHI